LNKTFVFNIQLNDYLFLLVTVLANAIFILLSNASLSSSLAVTGKIEYSEQCHRPSRTDLETKLGLHSTNFHVGTLGFNGIRVLIHAPGGDGEVRDGSKHIENIDLTAAYQG
jgi:hypothetical protein